MSSKNLVSVILPAQNEAFIISDVIKSILNQNLKGIELEILVIDGNSNDETKNIVDSLTKLDFRVKYFFNEKEKTPFAMNIGLNNARGNYVGIFGCHAVYEKNYILTCIEQMKRTKSIGCSGCVNVKTTKNDIQSTLSVWLLKSKFGVSSNSFRTKKSGYVDSLAFPVFKKHALIDVGGYDERLIRNQDNDMNSRLIDKKHKLFLTNETSSNYIINYSLKMLYNYSFRNGSWNGKTLLICPRAMKIHHFIPAFFASYILLIPFLYIIDVDIFKIYLFPGLLYILISAIETFKIFLKKKNLNALRLFYIFFKFHFYYGIGTIIGIIGNIIHKTEE